MLQRFERNISILGRSPRTFDNYSRHIAAMALHFQSLPTELDPEQVKDYLYELQQRSNTPKTLLRKCPCCKTGTLITIDVFGKRGPPQKYLLEKQPASVAMA